MSSLARESNPGIRNCGGNLDEWLSILGKSSEYLYFHKVNQQTEPDWTIDLEDGPAQQPQVLRAFGSVQSPAQALAFHASAIIQEREHLMAHRLEIRAGHETARLTIQPFERAAIQPMFPSHEVVPERDGNGSPRAACRV